ERQEEIVLADADDGADEGRGDACQSERAYNDADDGAGYTDGQRVLGSLRQRVAADQKRLPATLEEEAGKDEQIDDGDQHIHAEAHEGSGCKAEGDPEDDPEGERADQRR